MVEKLSPGLKTASYIFDPQQKLISIDSHFGKSANIGSNAENLTLCVLSLNRSELTIKLLDSLLRVSPGFLGKILIADNGSDQSEIDNLQNYLQSFPLEVKLVQFGRNYGVAGGRNKAFSLIETEWVLSLDNDIYFLDSPFKVLQEEISLVGSHFMNVPLLHSDEKTIFASGGHLYVGITHGKVDIGGGGISPVGSPIPQRTEPILCTFLFGGASVLKLETFISLGGFDEGYFVGFEDTDFSIKLFQSGLKVATSSTFSLVHDHPKPEKSSDIDYERERFSREVLYKSAQHFEKKHGFSVWNSSTESWLIERQKELGLREPLVEDQIQDSLNAFEGSSETRNKPQVLLVADVPNWAFGNISKQIEKYLSHQFDIKIIYADYLENLHDIWLLSQQSDLVHFFWPDHFIRSFHQIHAGSTGMFGITPTEFVSKYIEPRNISLGVYDHLNLEPKDLEYRKDFFTLASDYYVSSSKLFDIYSNIFDFPTPSVILTDGVDLGRFKAPNEINVKDQINIGWVGNSSWAGEEIDRKGYRTILIPALEILRNRGIPFTLFTADRSQEHIPHDEMPNFYENIDVLICSSSMEGTPNPVLEAMASGCAVVSTDVGVVREVLGNQQQEFILKSRTPESFAEALIKLSQNQHLLKSLRVENLDRIKNWDWSKKVVEFEKYFTALISSNRE